MSGDLPENHKGNIMDKFLVTGGQKLSGEVTISGSKNAALPILAATILAEGKNVIKSVPDLRDVTTMMQILRELGVKVTRQSNGDIETEVQDESKSTAPYELVKTMRASICVLGPLLAKRKTARVSLPGGCVIGVRPIDLHRKGLTALGAELVEEHGYIVGKAAKLTGREIFLGGAFGSSVTGTTNILMAATLAEGQTIIENAACEPEVQDLANFLAKMGAKINGIGTHRLIIDGVKSLKGTTHTVIPDRIEAGTFIMASAITGSQITIKNCRLEHLSGVIDKTKEVGVSIVKTGEHTCQIYRTQDLKPVDISTLPYPGFPTDMQAQLMAVLSLANGISVVTEKIYPDRFMHVAELNRLGAHIRKEGPYAIISGVKKLSGAPVMASDLRASAALVLAGLAAEGTTEIQRVYHIDRGYEQIEKKLKKLGADIKRVKDV